MLPIIEKVVPGPPRTRRDSVARACTAPGIGVGVAARAVIIVVANKDSRTRMKATGNKIFNEENRGE
jgi:hypothetical protein